MTTNLLLDPVDRPAAVALEDSSFCLPVLFWLISATSSGKDHRGTTIEDVQRLAGVRIQCITFELVPAHKGSELDLAKGGRHMLVRRGLQRARVLREVSSVQANMEQE